MTKRDLFHNLLTRGPADRVGLAEHFWPETTRIWLDQGYPSTAELDEQGRPAPVEPEDHFGYDMRACGGWFDLHPVRGVSEIVEETDEWIVRRDGSGAAFKYWKHKSGTPEHIDFRMSSREVWERDYRPHLLELDPGRVSLDWPRRTLPLARLAGQWVSYEHLFIWETMRGSLGDLTMYESLGLDPGWIHDFNRVYTDFYKAHFQYLIDTMGAPDGVWLYEDIAYRNGLFASPRMLETMFFPYFAGIVEFFHAMGLPVVLHSCGDVTKALPMIVDAGFDALNPMEVKAGCDILAYADQYADRLAFIGGLDVRILETGDRGAIQAATSELIKGMKSRGARYVFGTDHSVTPNVTYDAYRWALDAYHEHKAY